MTPGYATKIVNHPEGLAEADGRWIDPSLPPAAGPWQTQTIL